MHSLHLLFVLFLLTPLPLTALTGCETKYEPVCGFKEVCVWNSCTYFRTYNNTCVLYAKSAELVHGGGCEGAQKTLYGVPTHIFSDTYPLMSQNLDSYDFFTFLSAITLRLFAWAH